jgi:hypothetical protein
MHTSPANNRTHPAILLCLPVAILLLAADPLLAGPFDQSDDELDTKAFDQLSSHEISDWGARALKINENRWRHGETRHFIIHYFKRGQKIATRSEKFYNEIHEFFGKPDDLLGARKSQVFAFHDPDDWRQFADSIGMGNIAGVTRQHEFFYVTTVSGGGRYDSKGRVQAHEMTHLIFNRFFNGNPPLWLNEGIAEYFGQRETSSTTDFRRQMARRGRYPLDQLFAAKEYPGTPDQVMAFYGEASVIVDFLTYTQDRLATMPRFIKQMIKNPDLETGLKMFGYRDLEHFTQKYERYRKTRY